MLTISPELKSRWRKFKQNKRAYFSFILLSSLFLISLPAELLFNDKPLILRVNGNFHFPFIKDYSFADFGGSFDIPVQNYRSKTFEHFLTGRSRHVNPQVVFGDDNENIDNYNLDTPPGNVSGITTSEQSAPDVWQLNAPFRHSYKSYYRSEKISQQNLASPTLTKDKKTGEELPGAAIDGYYLGTDREGKCVLARLVYGFRVSILFGLALAISGSLVGCTLGAMQGYFGGWIDLAGQRLTEIWSGIPQLFLLIILGSIFARMEGLTEWQRYFLLFGILNLFSWLGMAAHMRAMFLQARNLDYVKAAKALGVSNFQIMKRHILPNSLTPVVTFVPFATSSAVLSLVSLDYLGFGVLYPAPSLGELLNQGKEYLFAWWILMPTFSVLVVLLALLTFIGEGVRNAFDPRHKG